MISRKYKFIQMYTDRHDVQAKDAGFPRTSKSGCFCFSGIRDRQNGHMPKKPRVVLKQVDW